MRKLLVVFMVSSGFCFGVGNCCFGEDGLTEKQIERIQANDLKYEEMIGKMSPVLNEMNKEDYNSGKMPGDMEKLLAIREKYGVGNFYTILSNGLTKNVGLYDKITEVYSSEFYKAFVK
jgi:hypothetical protein